jgi:uncharacterized repeat protein (TIGR03806 family)
VAQEFGVPSAEAVGPYLNNVLPQQQPGPTGTWQVASAFPNLTITFGGGYPFEPVYITQAPRSNKMYTCDKKGKIWFFDRDPAVSNSTLFLDISAKMRITRNAGLGTMAFHPDFGIPGSPNRGYVYLHYFWSPTAAHLGPANQVGDGGDEAANPGYGRLSRFTVQDGTTVADPTSELILMQQYDAHHWHNGGSLFFDNDGFLYLTSGDIGGDNNFYGAGQSLTEGMLGGLLRIDVDKDAARSHPIRRQPTNFDIRNTKPAGWPVSYSQEYYVPNDNPWLDANGGMLEEFWCLGLRSPHRASYDAVTGDIWVGDVGQQSREEISLLKKAHNYQWPFKEGNLTFTGGAPSIGTSQAPAYDYVNPSNSTGAAVIGGYIYRGFEHRADLEGRYIFADHQIGKIWVGDKQANGTLTVSALINSFPGSGFHLGISSFGVDSDGELYICRLTSSAGLKEIVKLVRTVATSVSEPPALLSDTMAFSNLATLTPASGLHPYEPNAPFWSDGAVKKRFMAVPNDGSHNTAAEQIAFSATGNWSFPTGTVFVKHFDYPVDDADPSVLKPVETRFMVHGSDGRYHGFTYKWNAAGTDANLLTGGDTSTIDVAMIGGGTRSVTWTFPSRTDCRNCHTDASGNVLGVRTHQLNGMYDYAESGMVDNQLRALNHIGLFNTSQSDAAISGYLAASNIVDPELPLENRVRSYLDTNCSGCHRPGGVYAAFDARFTTPLTAQGLINGSPFRDYGIAGQGLIRPRELAKSLIHHRANVASGNPLQMPPLGKNVVDAEATRIISQWIATLDPTAWPDNQYSAPDGPSVALDDVVSFYEGGTVNVPVLANDYDPDGSFSPVSLSIGEAPKFGSASVQGNEIRYVNNTAAETDTLTYSVVDQASMMSNVARVHLRKVSAAQYWRDLYSLSGAEAEWDYDADGDGLDNGIEFALGTSPIDPTDRVGITQTVNGNFIELSIPKSGYPGITYAFETSTTLSGWVAASVTVLMDTGELLKVQAALEERRFFRLKATILE